MIYFNYMSEGLIHSPQELNQSAKKLPELPCEVDQCGIHLIKFEWKYYQFEIN